MVLEPYGFNCTQLYQSKNIKLTNTKDLINQIFTTMNNLHESCEIIHGDLVPENIVFCASSKKMQLIFFQILKKLKTQAYIRILNFQNKIKSEKKYSVNLIEKHLDQQYNKIAFIENLKNKKENILNKNYFSKHHYHGQDPISLENHYEGKIFEDIENNPIDYKSGSDESDNSDEEDDDEDMTSDELDIDFIEKEKLILDKKDLKKHFRKIIKKNRSMKNKDKTALKKKLKEQMKIDIEKYKMLLENAKHKRDKERSDNIYSLNSHIHQYSNGHSKICSNPNCDKCSDQDTNYDNDNDNESLFDKSNNYHKFFKISLLDKILDKNSVSIKLINFYNSFRIIEKNKPKNMRINKHSSPELIFDHNFKLKIDHWSVGSTILQLLTRKTLINFFKTKTEFTSEIPKQYLIINSLKNIYSIFHSTPKEKKMLLSKKYKNKFPLVFFNGNNNKQILQIYTHSS